MRKIIRSILIVLNLVVVALLVGSTMAGTTAPSDQIVYSLLSYGYFFFLIANVAFVVMWLFLSRWWFLLSAAAIVLRWSFVPLMYQVSGCDKEATDEIRTLKVMSYNMHHCYGRSGGSRIPEAAQVDSNAAAFVQMIRQEEPGLLCMQEFLAHSPSVRVADSLRAMGYRYSVSACPAMKYSATICWSKHRLINPVYIDSSSKLQVDMAFGGDTLRLLCLHLHSYKLDSTDLEELQMIQHGKIDKESAQGTLGKLKRAILAHEQEWMMLRPLLESSPYPVLMTGDFNDTPTSYIYQQARLWLDDSFVDCGKGFGTTYHGSFPDYRIDFQLHSPSIETLSYRRLKCNISDHYPLVVTYNLHPQS